MKAFFVILNLLLTLSVCQSSVLTINAKPLEEMLVTGAHGGLCLRCKPNEGHDTLGFRFEGNNLEIRSGRGAPGIGGLADGKTQRKGPRLPAAQANLNTLTNEGGEWGREDLNPFFAGNTFSLLYTLLIFENKFSFRPQENTGPTLIQCVCFEKIEGYPYPLVVGKIDFTNSYPGILSPLEGEYFLVQRGMVTLFFNYSKIFFPSNLSRHPPATKDPTRE